MHLGWSFTFAVCYWKKEWVYRHIWNEGGEKNCKKLKAIKLVWTLEKIAMHYRDYILHFDA